MFRSRSPIVLIQNLVSAIFGYVGLLFVLRFIGATQWGFVSFGIGFVGVLSIFGDLGYSTAHSIRVSEGDDIGLCNGTFLFIKLVLGFIFVGMVIGALEIWTLVLHRGFQSPIEYYVILSLIPYYLFQNLNGFNRTYFNAKLKSVRFSIPPLIEALFRNSVFIVIAVILRLNLSHVLGTDAAIALSITYSVSYSMYFGFGLFLGRPWEIRKPTGKMIKTYTALALPLMLVTTVSTLNGNIDKVVIQLFWAAIPTGAFYTGQTIALIITSLGTSMSAFFLPLLIRMKNASKEIHNESIFEFERKISRYILPFVVILVVLSAYILNIFSQVYFVYFPILSFLAVRSYISVINSPYSSAMQSRTKLKTIAKIDIAVVSSNVVLILLLVPVHVTGRLGYIFGPAGAAFAAVLTGVASTLTYRINVSRLEGIGFNRTMFRQIPPAFIQAVFLYVLSRVIDLRPFVILFPVSLASIILYFLLSMAFREVKWKEIVSIAGSFSPSKIRKTFSREVESNYDDISEVMREE